MTIQYRNLLSSMESEELDEEMLDESEEETEAGTGEGEQEENTEINIEVEDGDVTVETGEGETAEEETGEETSEEEQDSGEETAGEEETDSEAETTSEEESGEEETPAAEGGEEETSEESGEETEEGSEEETAEEGGEEEQAETESEDTAAEEETSTEEETSEEETAETEESGEETDTGGDTEEETGGEEEETAGEGETSDDDTAAVDEETPAEVDVETEVDESGEPVIEPPTDDGDDGEYTEELGEIEENVADTEGEIDDTENNLEELEDVSEELDEAQEALEAMVEAGDVPAYAEKMFMDKLTHIAKRTGAQFRMEGSESHTGSKFQDYVFVDSLESSLKDVASQALEAIKRLLRQALDAAQRIWSMLTDATRRINARAKKAKEALKGMDFNKEFAEERGAALVKKHKQALSYATVAVAGGDKLSFNDRLVGELQKHEEIYSMLLGFDIDFGDKLVRMLKGEKGIDKAFDDLSEDTSEGGGSQTTRAASLMMMAYFESLSKLDRNPDMLPGGQALIVNKLRARMGGGKKSREEALDSDEGLAKGLGSFAQRKGALDDLADFVIGMTDPGGKFTKEFEKVQRAWFREMEEAAKKATREHADAANEDKGRVKSAVDKFGATQFAGAAIRIGYSASKDARKAWIKTLHGCNVILGGYASGKAVKSESGAQAEAA